MVDTKFRVHTLLPAMVMTVTPKNQNLGMYRASSGVADIGPAAPSLTSGSDNDGTDGRCESAPRCWPNGSVLLACESRPR